MPRAWTRCTTSQVIPCPESAELHAPDPGNCLRVPDGRQVPLAAIPGSRPGVAIPGTCMTSMLDNRSSGRAGRNPAPEFCATASPASTGLAPTACAPITGPAWSAITCATEVAEPALCLTRRVRCALVTSSAQRTRDRLDARMQQPGHRTALGRGHRHAGHRGDVRPAGTRAARSLPWPRGVTRTGHAEPRTSLADTEPSSTALSGPYPREPHSIRSTSADTSGRRRAASPVSSLALGRQVLRYTLRRCPRRGLGVLAAIVERRLRHQPAGCCQGGRGLDRRVHGKGR